MTILDLIDIYIIDNAKLRQDKATNVFGAIRDHRGLNSYIPENKRLNELLLDKLAKDITKDITNRY